MNKNMKQIHEAGQALGSDLGFWRPSCILLKTLKQGRKEITKGQYAYCKIFRNNPSRGLRVRAETSGAAAAIYPFQG